MGLKTIMKIVSWPITRLIPYARNARTIPQTAVDKVAASINEFGWQQPIVVDPDGVSVAGHVRRLAASKGMVTCRICGCASFVVRISRKWRQFLRLPVIRIRLASAFGKIDRAICGVQPQLN